MEVVNSKYAKKAKRSPEARTIEEQLGTKKRKLDIEPRNEEEEQESFKKVLKTAKKQQVKDSYVKPSINSLVSESKRIKERKQNLSAEDLKNMPSEVSSKFPVPRMKVAIAVQKKKVGVDPRFSENSGDIDLVSFSKKYSFIRDIESREIDNLSKEREKEDLAEEDKTKIGHAINIIKAKHEKEKRSLELQKLKSELRKKEIQKVAETGKTPYYYSEGELKKIQKERKYDELVGNGKLDSYMKRKLKKKAKRRNDSQKSNPYS